MKLNMISLPMLKPIDLVSHNAYNLSDVIYVHERESRKKDYHAEFDIISWDHNRIDIPGPLR